jgi:hypothetical protein
LSVGLTWRDAIPIVCLTTKKWSRIQADEYRLWLARLVLLFRWY